MITPFVFGRTVEARVKLRKRHEIQGVGGHLLFALVLATSMYITKIIKIRHI